jgi:hypothetical protein
MRQRPVDEGDEFGLVVGAGLTESVFRRNRQLVDPSLNQEGLLHLLQRSDH